MSDKDTLALARIAKHRKQMPRQYRAVYDVAMTGLSIRSAVNSQCAECMAYVMSEVRLCVSPQCPLFPYRPVHGVAHNLHYASQAERQSTNASLPAPEPSEGH